MTIPTASELALLRSRPQSARIWFSIYQPAVVFEAQVSGSWGQGVNAIPYDNVITGSYSNLVSGMTVLIGTTPYGRDVGKLRVRSATSSQITVAENSNINWLDNLYLTVIDFHEPWPIFPRMTLSSGNTIWYKDFDVAYSNQNTVLGSLVCMGPNHAGFVGTGTAGVYYSASGTYNLLGQALSYFWQFGGGSPSWYSGSVPGYVSYPTPGHYTTKLTATATNGVVEYGYRHISIYDRPGRGSKVPVLQWGISSFEGSRSDGGWSAQVWVRENIASIVDGALCAFFVDTDYAGTAQNIGGNAPNRGSVLFAGYINGETIHYDWEKSYVEFEIQSIAGAMKELECFSVALNSVASPAYWFEMLDMDVRRAIYHYLRWHTTVLDIADVEFRNFTDRKIQFFDADKTSLYDALGVVQSALFGQVVADRQGKLWIEQEAGIISTASGSVVQSIDLTRQDWMGEPYFSYQDHDKLNYVELGGIAYSGVITGTMTALLAGAPGAYVPRYGGSSVSVSGLALLTQAQLNELAGDFLAWRGSRYSDVEISLTGDYRNFDIAPQEQVFLTLNPSDTVRGTTWNRKPFIIQRMSGSYNPKNQTLLWGLSINEMTKGIPGTTIDIPPVAADSWPPGFDYPSINLPSLPSIIYPPNPTGELTKAVIWEHDTPSLAKTNNLDAVSPSWTNITPSGVSGSWTGYFHDPFQMGKAGYLTTSNGLYYITGIDTGSTIATLLISAAQIQAAVRAHPDGWASSDFKGTIVGCASPVTPGRIYIPFAASDDFSIPNRAWVMIRDNYTAAFRYTNLKSPYSLDCTQFYYWWGSACGNYNPNLLYVGVMMTGIEGDVVMKSTDNGYTFTQVHGRVCGTNCQPPTHIHIPADPSSNDQILWWCAGEAGEALDAAIFYSANQGGTVVDRTFKGLHAYGDGGGCVIRRGCVRTFPSNAQDVLAFVVRNTGALMGYGKEPTHLISSMDGGATWTLLKTFLSIGSGATGATGVRGLFRHPYNGNTMYASGNSLDNYFIASFDGGYNWVSKTGNYTAVIGFPSANSLLIPIT